MSLFCPGVDLDRFRARCAINTFPEVWNRWLVMRTAEGAPGRSAVESEAIEQVEDWLGALNMAPDPIEARMGSFEELAEPRLVSVNERVRDCSETISVEGDDAVWVRVDFVLRGQRRQMPWPVHNDSLLRRADCPTGVEWAVDRVGLPDLTRAVPPPTPGALERILERLEEGGKAIGEGVGVGALGLGLGLGLAYLLMRRYR